MSGLNDSSTNHHAEKSCMSDPLNYGDPIHTERLIRIIVAGAGPSGLLFAYKLQRFFQRFSLTIYEKNPEVSGTWFENRYPGCACDIPAHNYTYTFEPKKDWTTTYATADEIHQNHKELLALRKDNESILNSFFSLYLESSPLQTEVTAQFKEGMKRRLPGHLPAQNLIPTCGVGCRRLTTGPGYLESLAKSNVTAVMSGCISLTEHGCVSDDGTQYSVDVVICATSFNTSYIPRFSILGVSLLNLQDYCSPRPRSYVGIGVDNFPNFFTLLDPHSPIANGATIPGLEAQIDHILSLIDRYQTEEIHSFVPKTEAVDDFLAYHAAFMQKTAWTQECRSGYKQHTTGAGVILPQMWCESSLNYIEALKTLRADVWDIKYVGIRFSWLGKENKADNEKLKFREVLAVIAINIFAGHDTLAVSLRAILYHVARSPSVYRELQTEVDERIRSRNMTPKPVSYGEASRLVYLNAIIKESMRIHPATGLILERHVPPGGATLCNMKLPAYTVVGVNAWSIDRNKGVYGEDVDSFRPGRWLDEDQGKIAEMNQCFFTFGAGARACQGRNIAVMQIPKLVFGLFRNFTITFADPEKEWHVEGSWITKQTGMDMVFIERSKDAFRS